MRRPNLRAMALACGVVAACSDQPTSPLSPAFVLSPSVVIAPSGSLDEGIAALTTALFPKGLETAAGTRWETIKSKHAEGQGDPAQLQVAQTQLLELAKWVEQKVPQMDQPSDGESRQAAATRLVSYMAMYVYQGPLTPVPAYTPQADATFEVIDPGQTDTATTPSGYAGAGIEEGTVSIPAILTITQSPNSYPGNCNGPLQTNRCQYPLFYDFHIFPEQPLLKPLHIAVCHVAPESPRRPLDYPDDDEVHERLRLAHPLPADPDDYTPGATQHSGNGENIEVMPLSPLVGSSGVDCSDAPVVVASRLGRTVNRALAMIGRVLTPKPAYAVDQGPEHMFEALSPINLVDPQSQPDVAVDDVSAEGNPGTSPAEVTQGEEVLLSFDVVNPSRSNGGDATASSLASTYAVYLSTDAVIDASDTPLGVTGSVTAMLPDGDALQVVDAQVEIPFATPPGSYYIGVHVPPPSSGLLEVSTANNGSGVPLVVLAATGSVSGTVVDAFTGTPIAGATISDGVVSTTSNVSGAFVLAGVAPGSADLVASAPGYLDGTRNGIAITPAAVAAISPIALNPVSAPTDVRIVLEWGACGANTPPGSAPCDLDSHLTGPTAVAARFHVFYPLASRSFSDALSAANLDVDDVNGLGPETITITQQAGSGTYRYYVHNYTDRLNPASTTLAASGATVRVYRGATLLATYAPPAGGIGTIWEVFHLDGVTLTAVGQITHLGNPPVVANVIASESGGNAEMEVVRQGIAASAKP